MTNQIVHSEREFALVIQQAQRPLQVVTGYLRLILNYLYGLEILAAEKLVEVASVLIEHGSSVRCVFLLQDQEINRNAMSRLSQRGKLPVFILMASGLAARHTEECKGLPNVFVIDWTISIGSPESSLQTAIGAAFEAQGIVKLPVEADDLDAELLQKRIQERLKYVNTLPTLPEIVLRLTKMIGDPKTTADDLVELLSSDAAIVHKILQVVNSSSFSGTREAGGWTLKEAIVRLGLKQVGAIAQQIKLINALVRPEDSHFDLRRFWEHSVGCAYIADKLCTRKLIPLASPIEFDLYWISALRTDWNTR